MTEPTPMIHRADPTDASDDAEIVDAEIVDDTTAPAITMADPPTRPLFGWVATITRDEIVSTTIRKARRARQLVPRIILFLLPILLIALFWLAPSGVRSIARGINRWRLEGDYDTQINDAIRVDPLAVLRPTATDHRTVVARRTTRIAILAAAGVICAGIVWITLGAWWLTGLTLALWIGFIPAGVRARRAGDHRIIPAGMTPPAEAPRITDPHADPTGIAEHILAGLEAGGFDRTRNVWIASPLRYHPRRDEWRCTIGVRGRQVTSAILRLIEQEVGCVEGGARIERTPDAGELILVIRVGDPLADPEPAPANAPGSTTITTRIVTLGAGIIEPLTIPAYGAHTAFIGSSRSGKSGAIDLVIDHYLATTDACPPVVIDPSDAPQWDAWGDALPVVATRAEDIAATLDWLIDEIMPARAAALREARARAWSPGTGIPVLPIIVDELPDVVADVKLGHKLGRLGAKCLKYGMHIIGAAQGHTIEAAFGRADVRDMFTTTLLFAMPSKAAATLLSAAQREAGYRPELFQPALSPQDFRDAGKCHILGPGATPDPARTYHPHSEETIARAAKAYVDRGLRAYDTPPPTAKAVDPEVAAAASLLGRVWDAITENAQDSAPSARLASRLDHPDETALAAAIRTACDTLDVDTIRPRKLTSGPHRDARGYRAEWFALALEKVDHPRLATRPAPAPTSGNQVSHLRPVRDTPDPDGTGTGHPETAGRDGHGTPDGTPS